jgi:hypothetical protein
MPTLLGALVSAAHPQLHAFDSRELSNLLWGLARLGARPGGR